MRAKKHLQSTALRFSYERYIAGNPEREASFAEEVVKAEIARKLYDLRTKAKLTPGQLAKLVGIRVSVIDQLENADYDGQSLAMLQRIAAALNRRVEIRLVPLGKKLAHAA